MALALDAAAANSGGGNAVSGSVTLSTSTAHDVIVLCVFNESGSHNGNNPIAISSVSDTAGLSWAKRSSKTFGKGAVEIWYAIATATLSSDTITFNFASTTDDWSCMAFAVSGADTSSPWDTNGALPASNNGSGGTPDVLVSTTARNAFVFAFGGSESYFSSSSPQSPLTAVAAPSNTAWGQEFASSLAAYVIESSTQSNLTLTYNYISGAWGMLGDAIVEAGSGDGESESESEPPPHAFFDGTVSRFSEGGTSITCPLTTSAGMDVIIAAAAWEGTNSVTGVTDTAGLTWHQRSTKALSGGGMAVWYAIAADPLDGDAITIQFANGLSGSGHGAAVTVFAVHGADTSSAWDGNAALPKTVNGTGNLTASAVSTDASNTLLLAFGAGLFDTPRADPPFFIVTQSRYGAPGSFEVYYGYAPSIDVRADWGGSDAVFGRSVTFSTTFGGFPSAGIVDALVLIGSFLPGGPFGIDGTATGKSPDWTTQNHVSATLTTQYAGDVIVAFIHNGGYWSHGQEVSSITDSAGLTWTKRASMKEPDALNNLEIWYAIAPFPLIDDTITATFAANVDSATMLVFGVSGANREAPWDANAALTAKNSGSAKPSDIGISTTVKVTMLLALQGTNSTAVVSGDTGDGWTTIATEGQPNPGSSSYSSYVGGAYKIVEARQLDAHTTMAQAGGTFNGWALFGDAIVAADQSGALDESEPLSEPVSESHSASASESQSAPISEPVSETGSEPGSEPNSESASEHMSEPGSEGPRSPPPVQLTVVSIGV